MRARAQVFFKVLMGYRPPVPECMPQGFKDLLLACWVRALPRSPVLGPKGCYTVLPCTRRPIFCQPERVRSTVCARQPHARA